MGWFEYKGSRIHYEEEGIGDPILMLPGWAGSIDELSALRKVLAPSYRVIAADLPGSGRSGPQPRAYTPTYLEDDAGAFLALVDELAARPAHLIGFSDGGEEALLMAIMKPDMVRSVIAWGATGQLVAQPGMLDAFYDLIDRPIPRHIDFSEHLKGMYGEANARLMTQSWATALRAMIGGGGDISRSRAGEITCPTLLIAGEHDPLAPPTLVSAMASAVRGSEFLVASDAGHAIHLERPDWLARTILDRVSTTV